MLSAQQPHVVATLTDNAAQHNTYSDTLTWCHNLVFLILFFKLQINHCHYFLIHSVIKFTLGSLTSWLTSLLLLSGVPGLLPEVQPLECPSGSVINVLTCLFFLGGGEGVYF